MLLAGALPRPSVPAALLCGAAGAVLFALDRRAPPSADPGPRGRVERLAPLGLLLFLIPTFRLAVAPGADAAMYTALARSIAGSHPALSPAWGPVETLAYPRGFPCLIALFAPLIGLAKASLVASSVGFAILYAGLRGLFARVGVPAAGALALLGLLLSKTPQSFFGWGGTPSILAIGLVWIAAADWRDDLASALRTGWIAVAAVATHPVGALAGLAGLAVTLPWIASGFAPRAAEGERGAGEARARMCGLALLPVAVAALSFAWFALAGPRISAAEAHWIRAYQQSVERMLASGPTGLAGAIATAPVRLVARLPGILGDPYVAVLILAGTIELVHRSGRRYLLVLLSVLAGFSLLMEIGPRLPVVGSLVFPARFSPVLLLLTLPVIGRAWRSASARYRKGCMALAVAVLALALVRHAGWYQARTALATHEDARVLACLRESLASAGPRGEAPVLDGAYASAAQWAPALAGIAITRPHVHASLREEVAPWLEQLWPTLEWVPDATSDAAGDSSRFFVCLSASSGVRVR